MKQIFFSLIIISLLASCGSSSAGGDKKAQLDQLKKDYATMGDQIKKLEAEIAATDTTKTEGALVSSLQIQTSSFSHFIEVQGKVESEQNIGVTSQMGGVVTSILVSAGQQVNKGQVLATTDASVIDASIETVKKNLDFATTLFEKQQNLWNQKIGSEVQYLTAKNQKETLEKQLQTLQEQKDMTNIKSPINGTVDEVMIKLGEMAIPGYPAVRVVNLANMKVTADIAETYSGKVKTGDAVVVSLPDQGKVLNKTVSSAGQVIDPNKRAFPIEVRLSAAEQGTFFPNMVAVLKIKDYENANALVLPVNVVQNSESGQFVYVIKNDGKKNTAERVNITTGLSYNGQIEVLSGIAAGDQIITAGFQALNAGEQVSIKN